MKRRAFVQLLAALAGLPFLAKGHSENARNVEKERIPVGTTLSFAGQAQNAPRGWLPCDGSLIERAAYPELHRICAPYSSVTPCYPGLLIKAAP